MIIACSYQKALHILSAHSGWFYDFCVDTYQCLRWSVGMCAPEKQRRVGQTRWLPLKLTTTPASRPGEASRPTQAPKLHEPGSKSWPTSATGRQRMPGRAESMPGLG